MSEPNPYEIVDFFEKKRCAFFFQLRAARSPSSVNRFFFPKNLDILLFLNFFESIGFGVEWLRGSLTKTRHNALRRTDFRKFTIARFCYTGLSEGLLVPVWTQATLENTQGQLQMTRGALQCRFLVRFFTFCHTILAEISNFQLSYGDKMVQKSCFSRTECWGSTGECFDDLV